MTKTEPGMKFLRSLKGVEWTLTERTTHEAIGKEPHVVTVVVSKNGSRRIVSEEDLPLHFKFKIRTDENGKSFIQHIEGK